MWLNAHCPGRRPGDDRRGQEHSSQGADMTDFAHDIVIGADPEAVRRLLAERGDAWWTTNAVIHAEPGGFCEFRFPAAGFHAAVRVKTNRPGLVEWWCVDSLHPRSNGFKNRRDWVGTTIRFELEPQGDGATLLKLRHLGLGESATFYSEIFNVWAFYLESLKSLAETGKGRPFEGGEPGAQSVGMVAAMVPFKVRPEAVADALAAIDEFISAIEANETGTMVYRSYRTGPDAADFIHYMLFKDEAAHQAHRDSPYCAAFVGRLYPLCLDLPQPQTLDLYREAALLGPPGAAA